MIVVGNGENSGSQLSVLPGKTITLPANYYSHNQILLTTPSQASATAVEANVLETKTFYNDNSGSIKTGTMKNFDNKTEDSPTITKDSSGNVYFAPKTTGYYTTSSKFKASLEALLNSGVLDSIKQEKTVTAGTTATSVTPDTGKLLSKVTVNPTPSESKTQKAPISGSVTVSPATGKLLSSVVVQAPDTQEKTVTAGTSDTTVNHDDNKLITKVTVHPTPSQSKTETAGTSAKTVNPDSGKLLSSVTINPTPSQTKTVTAGTSNSDVTPDSGYLLSKVTVQPTPSQTKSASITGTATSATVTPDTGKLLSSVTVSCDRSHEAHTASTVTTQTLAAGSSVTFSKDTYAPNDIVITAENSSSSTVFKDVINASSFKISIAGAYDSGAGWNYSAVQASTGRALFDWDNGTWNQIFKSDSLGSGFYSNAYARIPIDLPDGYTEFKFSLKLYSTHTTSSYSVQSVDEWFSSGNIHMQKPYLLFNGTANTTSYTDFYHIDNTTSNVHFKDYVNWAAKIEYGESSDYLLLCVTPNMHCNNGGSCTICDGRTAYRTYGTADNTYFEGYVIPYS